MKRFGIGQAVRRVEDQSFLVGRGCYIDDIDLPRQCYGALVLSPHAHARIRSVSTDNARVAPGVLAVLTGADAAAEKLGGLTAAMMPEQIGAPPGYRTFQPVLAVDKVRFVGDRVAFVLAETPQQARDAAELVQVDYEPLPSVTRLEDAIAERAPRVWDECPGGNVAYGLMFGSEEAVNAAFAKAKHVVSLKLQNNRLTANPIEPRGALGEFNPAAGPGGRYTLHACTQNPHGVRQEIAAVLGVPETRIRVIAKDVGGGFGMKADAYPEDALVLWASRKAGRPVKWTATRSESLLTDAHARDQVIEGEMAVDGEGKILGIRARALQALGAFFIPAGIVPSIFSLRFIPGPYDIQAVHLVTRAVFTHTAPLGPYRGAGRPEAVYLTERLLDRAAQAAGLSPLEIRRRNLLTPDKLPYQTPTFYEYDSGEFQRVLERCLELADWKGFDARRKKSEGEGRQRGRAVTYYIEQGGIMNDRMELRCDPGGTVTIVAGTFSHGQGHATTYAQMVSEWLGVPFESIGFVQGDTDQVPFGRGTYAARSSMIGGCALKKASESLIEKAKPMAAALMETAPADIEFKEGFFRVAGTDKSMPFAQVAQAFYYPMGITDQFGVGLEASGTFATNPPNHPNGCHVCEVEVDPDTGEVTVERYSVVDDVGVVINPLICEGQVHGGLAQGIGQALMEHAAYDAQSGQLLSGSFMDYAMPRADYMGAVTSAFEEIPAKTNPLGIKGIGEAGAIGSPPTVINAVLDALRPLGVEHLDMPATPQRVWRSIRQVSGQGVAPN